MGQGQWQEMVARDGGRGWQQAGDNRIKERGWREGSAVKGTYCSFRAPRFGSHHLNGGSQPPVPGGLIPLLTSAGSGT